MSSLETDAKINSKDIFEEESYNEEEDEDFDPNNVNNQQSDEGGEDGEDDDYKDEQTTQIKGSSHEINYSHIESESGGLIKTRRGRLLQEELDRKRKYEAIEEATVSESVNDIWKDLQDMSNKRLKGELSSGSILADTISDIMNRTSNDMTEETILIKRDYMFAGELIHEEKRVPVSSAEGREYLNSIKFSTKKQDSSGNSENKMNIKKNVPKKCAYKFEITEEQLKGLRRPLKRPPILEQIINGSLKPKLTTLEKSSLDWATYVDKEGINDELTLHNRDGYLAKQDFLNKVEHNKDIKYKELRQKQLALQAEQKP